MTVIATDDHVTIKINDLTTVDHNIAGIQDSGIIALQLPPNAATEIQFRSIRLREIAK